MTTNKYRFLGGVFRTNENVLMTIAVVVACFFEYTKNHRILHCKWVNFVVC